LFHRIEAARQAKTIHDRAGMGRDKRKMHCDIVKMRCGNDLLLREIVKMHRDKDMMSCDKAMMSACSKMMRRDIVIMHRADKNMNYELRNMNGAPLAGKAIMNYELRIMNGPPHQSGIACPAIA
jgi:hypothetical protein